MRMNLNRRQRLSTGIFVIALQLGCAPSEAAEPEQHAQAVERHLTAMGTNLTVLVKAETRALGLETSERAARAIEIVEERLSTWRPGSELSLANSAPAQEPVKLSPELASDLQSARELWEKTDGYFDPALGPLIQSWGLRGASRVPDAAELEAARVASGWQHFSLVNEELVRDDERAQIEEGGFGKGIALDEALEAALVDGVSSFAAELGGQWIVHYEPDSPFLMGIAHPIHRERALLQLEITNGSAATSGNSERGSVVGQTRVGHILSSKTGSPARDFGSLTVVTPDALTADGLSTALFVMGPEAALTWAVQHTDVEIVVIELTEGHPRVRATSGLTERLTSLSPELKIEFVRP